MHAVMSCHLCVLDVYRLAGGGIVVRAETKLAGAAAGQAKLSLDRGWSWRFHQTSPPSGAVGGRWPDELYATVELRDSPGLKNGVIVGRNGGWKDLTVPAPDGVSMYYKEYAATPSGQVFALRVEQPRDGFLVTNARGHPVPHQREDGRSLGWMGTPVVVRLIGDGPTPPALPAGTVALALEAAPAGDLFVRVRGGVVLHAPPGADAWQHLPPAFARESGEDFRVRMFVGLDGRVVVSGCPRDGGGAAYRWDDGAWAALPGLGDGCVRSVAIQEDGTTWATGRVVGAAALLRLAYGAWEVVPLQVPDKPLFDPVEVMAVPGALWLLGSVGDDGDSVALATTLVGGKLLVLW